MDPTEVVHSFPRLHLSIKGLEAHMGYQMHSSSKYEQFSLEIRNNQIHKILLSLVKTHFPQVWTVNRIDFDHIELTAEFLEKLSKLHRFWKNGIEELHLNGRDIHMAQKEFEDWIGSLYVKILYFKDDENNRIEFNDKVISSVQDDLTLIEEHEREIARLQITDLTLQNWRKSQPRWADLSLIRTSFTMKAVFDLIQFAIHNNLRVCWGFGIIQCREEDGRYIIDLQKTPNLDVYIRDNYFSVQCVNESSMVAFEFEARFIQ